MSAFADQRVEQAMSLWRSRKPREAADLCRQVLAERANATQASLVLAAITRQTGAAAESVRVLEQARRHNPNHPALEPELAASLVAANRAAEALPILLRVAEAQPRSPVAHFWLGQAYLKLFRPTEGIRHLERARELDPGNPETLHALGAANLAAGRPTAAEPLLRDYLARRPDAPHAMHSLATALDHQNRTDEAEALYRQTLASAPGHPPTIAGLARLLQTRGRYDEALALASPGATAQRPDPSIAAIYVSLCVPARRLDEGRAVAARALGAGPLPAQLESALRFNLAHVESASGRDDEAFEQYRRANDLCPRTFNRDARARFTDQTIAAFSRPALAAAARATTRSDRPVLVVGMPRSGTTLVEQIIAAHPRAAGAGELAHLRAIYNDLATSLPGVAPANLPAAPADALDRHAARYLEALARADADAARVVDKMPHNYEVLGLAEMLLPGARVIHCTRSPLDTCLSCYTTQLSPAHDYAHSLDDLGWMYGQYRRLMAHWKDALTVPVLDVAYEELATDTEPVARRITDFLGLDWDDACLRHHEHTGSIATASVDQVRQPVYTSSIGRWKRYESHLDPLRRALEAAGVAT